MVGWYTGYLALGSGFFSRLMICSSFERQLLSLNFNHIQFSANIWSVPDDPVDPCPF